MLRVETRRPEETDVKIEMLLPESLMQIIITPWATFTSTSARKQQFLAWLLALEHLTDVVGRVTSLC